MNCYILFVTKLLESGELLLGSPVRWIFPRFLGGKPAPDLNLTLLPGPSGSTRVTQGFFGDVFYWTNCIVWRHDRQGFGDKSLEKGTVCLKTGLISFLTIHNPVKDITRKILLLVFPGPCQPEHFNSWRKSFNNIIIWTGFSTQIIDPGACASWKLCPSVLEKAGWICTFMD